MLNLAKLLIVMCRAVTFRVRLETSQYSTPSWTWYCTVSQKKKRKNIIRYTYLRRTPSRIAKRDRRRYKRYSFFYFHVPGISVHIYNLLLCSFWYVVIVVSVTGTVYMCVQGSVRWIDSHVLFTQLPLKRFPFRYAEDPECGNQQE